MGSIVGTVLVSIIVALRSQFLSLLNPPGAKY